MTISGNFWDGLIVLFGLIGGFWYFVDRMGYWIPRLWRAFEHWID
jgi:hypothetical protein